MSKSKGRKRVEQTYARRTYVDFISILYHFNDFSNLGVKINNLNDLMDFSKLRKLKYNKSFKNYKLFL